MKEDTTGHLLSCIYKGLQALYSDGIKSIDLRSVVIDFCRYDQPDVPVFSCDLITALGRIQSWLTSRGPFFGPRADFVEVRLMDVSFVEGKYSKTVTQKSK